MTDKRLSLLLSLLVGVAAASVVGLTTDQILQNVYDSSNTALRANIVAGGGGGGGFISGTLTSPDLVVATGTTTVGNYAGSNCSAGTGVSAISAAGTATCTSFAQGGGSTASPLAIVLPNKSATGTTANKLAKVNSSDGTVVITATTDTVGALGPVISGAGTTGSATVLLIGTANCVFDNAVTAGDFVGISSGTAGDCTDLGATFPSNKSVLGVALETGAAGTRSVLFQTPDIMNTTNIKGGNPGKGNITDLSYSGLLNASDIRDNGSSTSFTIGHRFEACGAAASGTVTGTLPASPNVGDIYTVIQKNASQTCVIARAGSQTIDGATSATLSAGVAIGKDCTVIYIASNNWHASGACS